MNPRSPFGGDITPESLPDFVKGLIDAFLVMFASGELDSSGLANTFLQSIGTRATREAVRTYNNGLAELVVSDEPQDTIAF